MWLKGKYFCKWPQWLLTSTAMEKQSITLRVFLMVVLMHSSLPCGQPSFVKDITTCSTSVCTWTLSKRGYAYVRLTITAIPYCFIHMLNYSLPKQQWCNSILLGWILMHAWQYKFHQKWIQIGRYFHTE